jgi:hypothetical protein
MMALIATAALTNGMYFADSASKVVQRPPLAPLAGFPVINHKQPVVVTTADVDDLYICS